MNQSAKNLYKSPNLLSWVFSSKFSLTGKSQKIWSPKKPIKAYNSSGSVVWLKIGVFTLQLLQGLWHLEQYYNYCYYSCYIDKYYNNYYCNYYIKITTTASSTPTTATAMDTATTTTIRTSATTKYNYTHPYCFAGNF